MLSTLLRCPHDLSRASTLMSLINVAWFLTANILLFSSLDTCRFAAPHLWWLIFSLLCLLYLIILEIVLIGIIFFLIWPIFFVSLPKINVDLTADEESSQLAWNIFLIVIGRHPMQRAHYLNPEVEKIPKTVVDQIPLVLYIPPPPGEETSSSTPVVGSMSPTPVMTRSSAPHSKKDHTYPPDQPRRKRRFVFLRRKQTKTNGDGGEKTPSQHKSSPSVEDDKPPERWEDVWETSEYPFVRLDENRATCAICLLDFAAPKTRVAREVIESWAKGNNVQSQAQNEEASKQAEQTPAIEPEVSAEEEGASQMKAAQAQQAEVREESVPVPSNTLDNNADDEEEAQPLRLMPCGHVFHVRFLHSFLRGDLPLKLVYYSKRASTPGSRMSRDGVRHVKSPSFLRRKLTRGNGDVPPPPTHLYPVPCFPGLFSILLSRPYLKSSDQAMYSTSTPIFMCINGPSFLHASLPLLSNVYFHSFCKRLQRSNSNTSCD